MRVRTYDSKQEMGAEAARHGAEFITRAIEDRGEANIVVATGASQFEMLAALAANEAIAWHRVNCFHLDEYVGLPITHPASFRLYLWQRFVSKLSTPPRRFYYLDAEGDCQAECERINTIAERHPIDVAFVGIGENGHLAFNDPPADFATSSPYMLVELDAACRNQQLGEGWFPSLDAVPHQAISMSIQQIMKSSAIVCTVPDERKARAVRNTIEGSITPDVPASILQRHNDCELFLDRAAAALLKA